MKAAVITARGQIPSTAQLKQLEEQSPGFFSSGYFVLAAVAGAPTARAIAATFTINLLRGGSAGQIVVTSKYPSTDPRSVALGSWLVNAARHWAKTAGVEVAVGGPAGSTRRSDQRHQVPHLARRGAADRRDRLVLGLALRAVLLPLVATAFSLLVAAATFGVLQLLFGGSQPAARRAGIDGPDVDHRHLHRRASALRYVYTALLLMRTREAFVAGGPRQRYVPTGLRQTAAAATGTGLVMVAALIPFSTTGFIDVREFGIGVAVAVLLDVLILRPVLLPAAEVLLGRFGWWPTRSPAAPPADANASRRLPPLFRRGGEVHP